MTIQVLGRMPAVVVVLTGILLGVIAEGIRWLVTYKPPPAPAPLVAEVLAETSMRDGSILAVHAFRRGVGSTQLNVNTSALHTSRKALDPSKCEMTLSSSFAGVDIALWLTRRDPVTGKSLDFAWWLRTSLVDQLGNEVSDESPTLHTVYPITSSCLFGPRPLVAVRDDRSVPQAFVASSGFRFFRAESQVRLKFFDTRNEVVAEVLVANPCVDIPTQPPDDSLLVTKRLRDVEVTLSEMRVQQTTFEREGLRQVHRSVTPVFELRHVGVPATDWRVASVTIRDALGNQLSPDDVFPSAFHEPAWTVSLVLMRKVGAPGRSDELTDAAQSHEPSIQEVEFRIPPPKCSRDER